MEKLDEETKKALLRLAHGYVTEEKIVTANKNGKPEKIEVRKKEVPPDIEAIQQIEYYKSIGKW